MRRRNAERGVSAHERCRHRLGDVVRSVPTFERRRGLVAISLRGLRARRSPNRPKKRADYGSTYLLLSILICVLGGISPFGGVGRIAGMVVAVLALQFQSSRLNILGVNNFATDFVRGALLQLIMAVNRAGITPRR